jgi:hypothetical protein
MTGTSASSTAVRFHYLADHARLERLLDRLIGAFEANDREDIQRIWTELEPSLLVHLEAEEELLIPALRRSREKDAITILDDHKRIRTRLAELGAGIDLHIVRLETARALVEDLQAHAQHEDEVYQWADVELGEAERTSLLSAISRTARRAVRSLTD